MDIKLLEPLKYYESEGREGHHANVQEYLEKLVEKSGVNLEQNRETIKKWKAKQAEIDELEKKISRFKIFRVLLIIGIALGVVLMLASIGAFGNSAGMGALLLLLGIAVTAASVIVIFKKINPVIKSMDKILGEKMKEAKKLEDQGWAEMQPLNALFTDYDAVNLVEKTLPDFEFEKNFSKDTERLFVDKYDFRDLLNSESSMLDTLSGKYAGNPFVFGRRKVHQMGTHTYHGTLVISWTETYRDKDGKVRTRRRTQTLHASVIKPKPYYSTNTFLLYGNQAAPKLTFSREHKHIDDLSERALEKKIKKGEAKLQKKAEKTIKDGGNFQEMANIEFDVLFGATDRNNEVEFRFMYTPIGQRSTMALLKDDENYGDDFDFFKYGKCNVIISEHAQSWKMSVPASDYRHFDFEVIKSRFITINDTFFKSLFFDFAPLFSVPAYLEEPCASLEDIEPYDVNYTYYEHEVISNALDTRVLLHNESATEAIIKTSVLHSSNGTDLISVTANSYKGVNRVDFIPVLGGDGRLHGVPVPWVEYIPVSRTTRVSVGSADKPGENASVYCHGMWAGIMK